MHDELVISKVDSSTGGKIFIVKFEIVFWFFDNIEDILDYKDLLDRFFTTAIAASSYNHRRKGFKIYDIHFKKICKDWKAIDMILLLDFAI